MLPWMKIAFEVSEPGNEGSAQDAGFDEQKPESGKPLLQAPQIAVLLQHYAEVAKCILHEKKGIEKKHDATLPDSAADGKINVKCNRLVLGFFYAVPMPNSVMA